MAPSAPQELQQQGMREVDTAGPAASEQQQDEAASTVDEKTKEDIEKAKRLLGSCSTSCSEMLKAARGPSLELRCLEFLEKELSYITEGLTADLSAQQHVDGGGMMKDWVEELLERSVSDTLGYILKQADADPQCHHTMLRGAMQWLRPRHRYEYQLLLAMESFYRLAEHPGRYTHLLAATFPQEAEEGDGISLLTLYMMIMFPYGYKFEKDQLVMKWLREGLFQWKKEEADSYFDNLVNHNMITRAATNSRHNNNPDEAGTWQWNVDRHEHQFLASKFAEMGLVFTSATLNLLAAASTTDHRNEAASRVPRRLALHHDVPNIPSLLEETDMSQTRLLAVSGGVSGVPVHKFVNLVLLDVEGWEKFEDEHLLQVCTSKMFFLKYLGIRNTRVRKLPTEIKELCSLDILDASHTHITEIPLQVFVATALGRLDLRGTPIRQVTLPKQTLGLHDSLHSLLLGGQGMINASETIAARMPHDIRRFRNLETLVTIDLSDQPASFVKALGDLNNLRVLAITWFFHQSSDMDYCDALRSSIKRWTNLRSLTIHCGFGCSMEFLGSLSDVPSLLQTFKVTVGRFPGVPQWYQETTWLSFLQVTVCKLGAHDLEVLGGLPALRCLVLSLDFIPKEAIAIKNEGFLALQRFSIECSVPWLTFESGAMPELIHLQLNLCACPMTPIGVPLGISKLCRLTEVSLWYNIRYDNSSSIKMVVEAVRKEVVNCRNATQVISLFVNGIEQDGVHAVDEYTTAMFDIEITEVES